MDYYNWFLAPYVHYDKLTYPEVRQIIQGFVHQLNQTNRTGAQSAFTNIGLRINCPSYLKEVCGREGKESVPVIHAGRKLKDLSYDDFREEAGMIYRAFMEVMIEGDGNGLPFTFPIITTAITKDWKWQSELVDITVQAAASMGSPYFLNLTTDYLNEKYVQAMCCRLLVEHSGGVWQAGGMGTGSNKVVTINLPRVALEARNENEFFSVLDKKLEIARKALLESNEIIRKSLYKWNLLPFLRLKTSDGLPYYNFKERKLTFGVIGMDDCLHNLLGTGITSKDGLSFAEKTIRYIAGRIAEFSQRDGIAYTLEQTPAESATYKLALKDKEKFGKKAHTQGRGRKVYYANSTHVPYRQSISLIEKIETEARFHPYFNGGVICHVFMGESRPELSSMKRLIQKMSRTQLAYFTFSPDFSICKNNHVIRGKTEKCPKCGEMIIDHVNRVVGFFTRTSRWNPGKQKEYQERKRFLIK